MTRLAHLFPCPGRSASVHLLFNAPPNGSTPLVEWVEKYHCGGGGGNVGYFPDVRSVFRQLLEELRVIHQVREV